MRSFLQSNECKSSVGQFVGWLLIFSCGHVTLKEALSVRPLVGRSVGRSVGEHESKSGKTSVSAPAHPSATGIGRVSGLDTYLADLAQFYFSLIFSAINT